MIRRSIRLRRIAAPIVSAALIGLVLWTVDLGQVGETVRRVSPLGVIAIVACLSVNLALGAQRLRLLTRYLGRLSVDFTTALRANVAGLLSSLIIFNVVGSIIGRHAVLRSAGLSASALTGLVTLERLLLAAIGGLFMAAGFLLLQDASTLQDILADLALVDMILAMALAAAFCRFVFGWRREIRWAAELLSRAALARTAALGGLTIAAHSLMIACYVLAAFALDLQASWLELAAAGAVVAFAAGLPISVNGWGVREISALYAFGRLGISAESALTLSVMIGVLSTLVVLLFAPVVMRRSDPQAGASLQTGPGAPAADPKTAMPHVRDGERQPTRLFIAVVGPLAALLVFFQIHVEVDGVLLSVNLADPLALVTLTLAAILLIAERGAPVPVPRGFLLWLGALSVMMLGGFVLGYMRFGPIDWAINNRLAGWPIILGYVSLGALLVNGFGQHGLRRLAEVLICAAAATALVSLLHLELALTYAVVEPWLSNFEGFSRNRNTYAFQLLAAAAAALAYSRAFARRTSDWALAILMGVIFFAIWRTYSKTGVLIELSLILFAVAAGFTDRRVVVKACLCAVGVYAAFKLHGVAVDLFSSTNAATPMLDRLYVGSNQSERWMTIERGLDMWRAHPIFGAGLGAFAHLDLGEFGGVLVIHSTPIWLLAEFGVVGLAVALGPPLFWLWRARRAAFRPKRPYQAFMFGVALCFGLFSLPHDIFYQRIFWLALGGIAAAWGLQARAQPSPAR
ncbi:MAG: lysylphosphatidylglycerol synthase transmembrane domain-containing protein [Marivibrio sp.]|uniref:lysylphosphatidylglycerol synthase transmembrane domain-containing protein n=1 Tax=Marivibrio sp. TaxID=2039719 RepID=UPI0032EC2438